MLALVVCHVLFASALGLEIIVPGEIVRYHKLTRAYVLVRSS